MTRRPTERDEFVVPPELAEVAERLGVPLPAGSRVRFEVVDVGPDDHFRVPAPREGDHDESSSENSATLRGMTEAPDTADPLSGWDPRRRAALEQLWARFEQSGPVGPNLGDELVAERRREAAAEDELVPE
jgi:hypothetical protein